MAEPEGVVTLVERTIGPDQLLAREGEQRASETLRTLRQQLRDRGSMEQTALDRRSLQHGSLVRLQPVDARRQERMDRCRHRLVGGVGVVGEHCQHLLDEEWVAIGRADDPVPQRCRDGRVVHKALDQRRRLGGAQCGQRDEARTRPGRRPRRPGVEQVGACQTEEQDRRSAREAEHVLEEVEQGGLGPVDVVHRDDERP